MAEGEGFVRSGESRDGIAIDARRPRKRRGAFCRSRHVISAIPRLKRQEKRQSVLALPFSVAEGEGFEPPEAFTSTVFKFYFLFVVFRLLLLFNRPNYRKISVLTALLFDNSGFLLCFGIVSHSLALLIFSAFLTAFCRGFVDCFAWIKKFICCFILFLFPTNTRHGAKQIFAYQSNQESV